MDDEFLLAINGDWDALLAALRENRMLAHQTDGNGMTLLHWVCLHQDIPTEVLIKIVFANPHAVNVPNEAGHVPIDLAVQAECEERILEVLRAADKSRQEQEQEHEPEPAPPIVYGSGRPFSPAAHGGPYGYNYPEEEDMTFENPRYFANPNQPHQPRDPYANGHAHHAHHQQLHAHAHEHLHRHDDEEEHDRFGNGHDDDYDHGHSHSNGGTPHHQLDYRGRPSPTREDPSTPMRFGVARKPLFSIYSGQANAGDMQYKSLSLGDDRFHNRNNYDTISVATDEYSPYRGDTASDSHLLQQQQQQQQQQMQMQIQMQMQMQMQQMQQPQPTQSPSLPAKWEPKGGAVTKGTSFPPRWKQSRSCHVCANRFTLTHRRHHCRNCGFSVCGQHSTNRVPLPRFGLGEPQRVCDKCFLAGRHVFGMGPLGSAGSVVMGGSAMSVASGSERHYESQPQYGGGRRDSFGSYHP